MTERYEELVNSIKAEARLSASAFHLISEDFERTFAYDHPEEENLGAYSHRFYEILFRCCTEFEILAKVAYSAAFQETSTRKNISQLSRILEIVNVPSAKIKFVSWEGNCEFLSNQFIGWDSQPHGLEWFRSYNSVKHDRHANFRLANLKNCIDSMSSLFFLIVCLGGIKYSSFYQIQGQDFNEFPIFPLNFSIKTTLGWSPPRFLDGTPDAP